MAQKQPSKRKRAKTSLPVLGAAGFLWLWQGALRLRHPLQMFPRKTPAPAP
jgi:hypothetical protein